MLNITQRFTTFIQQLTITQWYAVSLAALGFALRIIQARLLSRLYLWVRFHFLFICYRLLLRRRCWSSVTWLQGLLFVLYLGVNVLCILLFAWGNLSENSSRSAILSTINMIPLFIASRSSFLVSYLGIPLHVYHLLHHWIGRVSILQAFLHVILVFVSRIDRKQLNSSGMFTAIVLGCIFIFSLFPIRRYIFEIFRQLHHLLATVSIAAILWHVIKVGVPGPKKVIFPLISLSLWVIELVPFLYNLRIRSRKIEITTFYRNSIVEKELDTIQIELTLSRPIIIRPGQFVYLRIRDFYFSEKVQTHPFMISWWEPVVNDRFEKVKEPKAKSLIILIRPVNGLTRRLGKASFLENISFDGPRGQDLRLEEYDNVLLVAKGIGLAGVLLYAKHLLNLKSDPVRKREVITRKLDLYWELDNNSQEKWGGPFLRKLQEQNNEMSGFLQVWCYFPSKKTSEPIVKLSDNNGPFQYFYPESEYYTSMPEAITMVATTSAGRSIIVTCGVSSFTNEMRATTLTTMWSIKRAIEFVETEYRPLSESLSSPAEQRQVKGMKISRPISSPLKAAERAEKLRIAFV